MNRRKGAFVRLGLTGEKKRGMQTSVFLRLDVPAVGEKNNRARLLTPLRPLRPLRLCVQINALAPALALQRRSGLIRVDSGARIRPGNPSTRRQAGHVPYRFEPGIFLQGSGRGRGLVRRLNWRWRGGGDGERRNLDSSGVQAHAGGGQDRAAGAPVARVEAGVVFDRTHSRVRRSSDRSARSEIVGRRFPIRQRW